MFLYDQCTIHTETCLSTRNQDGVCVGSEAEPIVQGYAASSQGGARTITAVGAAEQDGVCGRETVRARCAEALSTTRVHGASTATLVIDASATVGERGHFGRAGSEWINWFSEEGELSVGVGNPEHHLLVGHQVGGGLQRRHYHDQSVTPHL